LLLRLFFFSHVTTSIKFYVLSLHDALPILHRDHDDEHFNGHGSKLHEVIIPGEVNAEGYEPPAEHRAGAPHARLMCGEQCPTNAPTGNGGAHDVDAGASNHA